ncbi:hypothetical protein HJD18_10195 [Thermoleophilia bacterium SCSIO 60948]|nr:hypothetical protein HJD18_10195 [Thermoleophilia bacterium SCSIO 60948]
MKISIGRRSAALIATGALTLGGAGVAQAGIQNEYQGTEKGNQESSIGLDVNRFEGKRVVENVNVSVDTMCDGSTLPFTTGSGSGRINVKPNDTFEGARKFTNNFDESSEARISIEGKVVSRDVVRGSLRIRETRNSGTCDTGPVAFRLTRADMGSPQR